MRELLEDVRAERSQPRDELGWMSMLRAPEFLEALFEILEPSTRHRATSRFPAGASATCSRRRSKAITAIGTREAVRRYDALLARGDDLRWLRGQRDRIAAEVLA